MKDFFKSFLVSGANFVGPIILLVVFQQITNPEIFIGNYRNYYNVTLLSTFITLQTQATMLRRDYTQSLQSDVVYFLTRSFLNLFYGIAIGIICFFMFSESLFPNTGPMNFFYCIVSAYFFQIFQGIINILNRRQSLNYQLLSTSVFYFSQLLFVLVLVKLNPQSDILRILAIVFASIIILIMSFRMKSDDIVLSKSNEDALTGYARWLVPHVVSAFLIGNYEKIYILNNFENQIAYEFILLSQFMMILAVVPLTINRVLVPKIFNNEVNLEAKSIKEFSSILLILIFCYQTYALVVFYINEILLNKSVFDWRIYTIMALLQFFNMIYLILVSFLHLRYDTVSISIITVSIASFYLACLNFFEIDSVFGVVMIALGAKVMQVAAVSFKVWSQKVV